MTATLAPPPVAPPTAPSTDPRGRVGGAGIWTPVLAVLVAVLLSSLALGPLFADSGWFGATLLVTVAVVVVGGLATAARLPVFLVPIAMALALLSALVARFTVDAPLGFVPSPDALASLRLVLSDGMSAVNRFAPPVPVGEGIAALTALGVGCVALTVFVLQVNLRMPTPAGAPLVALYVVPSLVLSGGSPWWAFTVVVVGWLLLLVADERVGLVRWGRLLRRSDSVGGTAAMTGVSGAALRLGATAVVAALVLPVLVPGLADAVLGRNGAATGTTDPNATGSSPGEIDLNPLVTLRRDLIDQPDVVVMKYTTAARVPSYLRTVVLETFDGESWKPRPFDSGSSTRTTDPMPDSVAPGQGVATTATHYDFVSTALATTWLPVPEHPTTIAVDGDWFVDSTTGTVFAPDATTRGASWSVDALQADPTPDQLAAAPDLSAADQQTLAQRVQVPAKLSATAATVTAGATTKYDQALAIQNWFRTTFTYSTSGVKQDQSSTYLEQFLNDRKGYCEQFAATMALMSISRGIPARVVVGFVRGTHGTGDQWTVSAKDAHAWPELYFQGVGWVPFEPTPRAASDGAATTPPPYAGPGARPTKPPVTPTTTTDAGNKARQDLARDKASAVAAVDAIGSGADVVTPADVWRRRALGALLLVALLVAAVPAVWRWGRRRRRLSAGAGVEDAWSELRDTARDLGVPWSDAHTPRQAVGSLVDSQHLTGAAAEAATRIGRTTERSRYAPVPPTGVDVAHDVVTVRSALLSRTEWQARIRALLLPASLRRG